MEDPNAQPPQAEGAPRRRRGGLRRGLLLPLRVLGLLLAGILGLVLGVLLFVLAPPSELLRRAALPIAREALNHPRIQISSFRLSPLSGLELGGVWLGPPEGYSRAMATIRQQRPDLFPLDRYPDLFGEPKAVHMNVTIVPDGSPGEPGYATLWPWGEEQPTASWINYMAGTQNIANAGTVKTTASSEADPDFSVYAAANIHVVIDVLGYFTN